VHGTLIIIRLSEKTATPFENSVVIGQRRKKAKITATIQQKSKEKATKSMEETT
jgi:hypothetical protein